VPESEIVAGELVALLTTVRLPVTVPMVLGAKLTVSIRLFPAVSVTVPVRPLSANPEPVRVAWEMVTAPVPLFVREIV